MVFFFWCVRKRKNLFNQLTKIRKKKRRYKLFPSTSEYQYITKLIHKKKEIIFFVLIFVFLSFF